MLQKIFTVRDHYHLHTSPVDPPQRYDMTRGGNKVDILKGQSVEDLHEVSAGKVATRGSLFGKLCTLGTLSQVPDRAPCGPIRDQKSLLLQQHMGKGSHLSFSTASTQKQSTNDLSTLISGLTNNSSSLGMAGPVSHLPEAEGDRDQLPMQALSSNMCQRVQLRGATYRSP
jgi:hypothetical protein